MSPALNTERAATGALEWNDLSVILAICRAGSLSGAARSLGKTHSTVFRNINAIEEKTGVRFFDRFSHGYVMTEAGQIAERYAKRVEQEVHALGLEVLDSQEQITAIQQEIGQLQQGVERKVHDQPIGKYSDLS